MVFHLLEQVLVCHSQEVDQVVHCQVQMSVLTLHVRSVCADGVFYLILDELAKLKLARIQEVHYLLEHWVRNVVYFYLGLL
jgi:hypothetical protein